MPQSVGMKFDFYEVSQVRMRTKSVSLFKIRNSDKMSLPVKGGWKRNAMSAPEAVASKRWLPRKVDGSACTLLDPDSSKVCDWLCKILKVIWPKTTSQGVAWDPSWHLSVNCVTGTWLDIDGDGISSNLFFTKFYNTFRLWRTGEINTSLSQVMWGTLS